MQQQDFGPKEVVVPAATHPAAEWALRSAGAFIIRTADSRESLISQIA